MMQQTGSFLLLVSMLTVPAAGQSVRELTDAVSAQDRAACLRAIELLGQRGPRAEDAVPALIKTLASEDARSRAEAAWALGAIGPDAARAVDSLIGCLKDTDENVRANAARGLGQIGHPARSAAPALVKAAVDENVTVRREAVDALGKIDAPRRVILPLLTQTLQESDPQLIVPALEGLTELAKESPSFLHEDLADAKACYWACLIVAEIGRPDSDTVPLVTGILRHKHPECRMQALQTLAAIGKEARSAVPKVVSLLENDDEPAVRYAAAYALGRIGDPPRSQKALAAALQSRDPSLRVTAGWSLLQLDPGNRQIHKTAFEAALHALESQDASTRSLAVRVLGEVQAPDERSRQRETDAFLRTLKDSEFDVVSAALDALTAQGARSVPVLQQALGDERLQPQAVEVARRLGPQAKALVPALIAVLKRGDGDNDCRREVHFALGAVGAPAAFAVPQLIASLSSEVAQVRYTACYALGQIGPSAQAAAPVLRQHLDASDTFTRFASMWALVRIQPDDKKLRKQAVSVFVGALQDEREHVRSEAARALAELAADAKPALPALQALLADPDNEVRAAAAEAVDRIHGLPEHSEHK